MKTKKLVPPNKKVHPLVRHFKRFWMLWLMALPALIHTVIFSYLPKIGIIMAFQDLDFRKGIFSSPWVGFKNFEFLFASSDAWLITRNTVAYNIVFIFGGLVLSVGLALLLNELTNKNFSKVVQTIFIMPFFLSMAVVAMAVLGFLDYGSGYLNGFLEQAGKEPQFWYEKIEIWPALLIFIHFWKGIGYSSVIYTAVISGISQEYYEAAALDGATRWQQIRYITLPHLKFIISINLIRSVSGIFNGDFGLFYTVTQNNGTLYPVTLILDTYIYNALSSFNNLGMTTAAGVYQSVVGCALLLITNAIVKKMDPDSSLF